MNPLLHAVLTGKWPVVEAIAWLDGRGDLPPDHRHLENSEQAHPQTSHAIIDNSIASRTAFEDDLLDLVRSQAEPLLLLAIKKRSLPLPPVSPLSSVSLSGAADVSEAAGVTENGINALGKTIHDVNDDAIKQNRHRHHPARGQPAEQARLGNESKSGVQYPHDRTKGRHLMHRDGLEGEEGIQPAIRSGENVLRSEARLVTATMQLALDSESDFPSITSTQGQVKTGETPGWCKGREETPLGALESVKKCKGASTQHRGSVVANQWTPSSRPMASAWIRRHPASGASNAEQVGNLNVEDKGNNSRRDPSKPLPTSSRQKSATRRIQPTAVVDSCLEVSEHFLQPSTGDPDDQAIESSRRVPTPSMTHTAVLSDNGRSSGGKLELEEQQSIEFGSRKLDEKPFLNRTERMNHASNRKTTLICQRTQRGTSNPSIASNATPLYETTDETVDCAASFNDASVSDINAAKALDTADDAAFLKATGPALVENQTKEEEKRKKNDGSFVSGGQLLAHKVLDQTGHHRIGDTAGDTLMSNEDVSMHDLYRSLDEAGHGLSMLYMHLLMRSHRILLANELNFVLSLLAVPLSVQLPSKAKQTDSCADVVGVLDAKEDLKTSNSMPTLLTTGSQARHYASLVLCGCGALLRCLGSEILEAVERIAIDGMPESFVMRYMDEGSMAFHDAYRSSSPTTWLSDSPCGRHLLIRGESSNRIILEESEVRDRGGEFLDSMVKLRRAALAMRKELSSHRVRTDMAFNSVKVSDGVAAGLLGLGIFTSEERTSRSVEEQRRLKNRENVRDAWYELMKTIANRASGFGLSPHNKKGKMRDMDSLSDVASSNSARQMNAEVYCFLQKQASELLRSLMPGNFVYFAELFVGAVMQAAATGDAFMDKESHQMLEKLASKGGISRLMALGKRMPSQLSNQSGELHDRELLSDARDGGNRADLRSSSSNVQRSFGLHIHMEGLNGQEKGIKRGDRHWSTNGTSTGTDAAQTTADNIARTHAACSKGPDKHFLPRHLQHYHHNQPYRAAHYHPRHGKRSMTALGGAVDEASANAARFAEEFPPCLRLYVLFLEAADSNKLNNNVGHVIARRLHELVSGNDAAKLLSPGPGMTEKAIAVTTLASFLGYLAFTSDRSEESSYQDTFDARFANDTMDITGPWNAFGIGPGFPLDIVGDLKGALDGERLVAILPWASRYLRHLQWSSRARNSHYYQRALRHMAELRARLELSPSHPRFGLAALCFRSLLDETASILDIPPATSTVSWADQPRGSLIDAVLQKADSWVDVRFVELCCPSLLLMSRVFTASTSRRVRGSTKDVPENAKDGLLLARRTSSTNSSTPRTVRPILAMKDTKATVSSLSTQRSDAESPRRRNKARLQRTFLEQYSSRPNHVKLKEVVEFTADVIGHNASTSIVAKLVPQAVDDAASKVESNLLSWVSRREDDGVQTSHSMIDKDSIELYAAQCFRKEKDSAINYVIDRAYPEARYYIPAQAVQAMKALTTTDLEDVIIETAAAIVAEVATASFEKRIVGMVAEAVESSLHQRVKKLTVDINRRINRERVV